MPQSIDPNAIQWSGPAAEKVDREVRKDETNITQGQASAAQSRTSTQINEKKLPFVERKEAAETTKTEVEADRTARGEVLGKPEREEIGEVTGMFNRMEGLYGGFKDDYAGSVINLAGQAENALQEKFPSFGTPGQKSWWQDMAKTDMLERNKYFGASLTEGEKQAWAETTVRPGMDPAIVRQNILKRRKIARDAMARTLDVFLAGDYRPEQIKAAVGAKTFDTLTGPQREAWEQEITAEQDKLSADLGIDQTQRTSQVAGEGITAPRLSGSAENKLNQYARSAPDFSPEAYAQMAVDTAVAEGLIRPEQRDAIYEATLQSARSYFEGMSPEARARIGPGLDYSESDKHAREQAGLSDVLLQAAKNVPESAVQLLQGIAALPVDTIASIVAGERSGSFKTTTDLAGELIAAAGGAPSGENMQAVANMLDERYGGWQALKNTAATDPLGFAGDLSLALTGGGSAAARLPGALGRTGKAVATAGRVIDPLSALVAGAENTPKALAAVPEAVTNAPGAVAGTVLGLSTGVPGGQGYRTAARVGFERGVEGPTPRSDRFLEQMRGGDPTDVIARAEEAVRAMQEAASNQYRSGMLDVSGDATVLSFDGIDKTLNDLQRRAYYKGQVRDARAAAVLERTRALVDEWKALDPAEFHTPEGMDTLKQRIGDVAEDFAKENDRNAAGVAKNVYRAVRGEIAKQVPTYDRTMRNYEKAADTLSQIRKTFSLNPKASVDTQLRKLQSLMRNNANTNYGYREQLAKLMQDQGGVNLMDDLSAHSVSSLYPRGLASIPASAAAGSGIGGILGSAINPQMAMGMLDPSNLLMVPATIPRAVGEASYYAGAGAGAAARGVRGAYRMAEPTLDALLQKYKQNPTTALAMAQTGSHLEGVGEERDAARYSQPPSLALDSLTSGELPPEEPAIVLGPGESFDPVTDEIIGADGSRRPAFIRKAKGGYVKGAARAAVNGATFAWGDEIEGRLRALAQRSNYRDEVDRVRAEQRAFSEEHPVAAPAWEVAGAILPSLFTRSGAGLTGAVERGAGRALSHLGTRYPRAASFGVGMAPDIAMGVLYGAGTADTVADIPRSVAEESALAAGMYGALRGGMGGLRALKNKYLTRR